MNDIPLPNDPRHQRFADLVLRDVPKGEAYGQVYPNVKKSSRNPAAGKLLRRPDVQAYMNAIRTKAADETTLTLLEIRRFLARVVRTPFSKLDPDDSETSQVIKSVSETHSETSSSRRLEKLDPLKAIELDMKLAQLDSDPGTATQLIEAIRQLGGAPPIPTDHMELN